MSEPVVQRQAVPDPQERHPFWEPRWYDDQHCCATHAKAGDFGLGSHYHCPGCWAETGMYGHHTTFCKATGTQREFHRCCPGDCALETKGSANA